MKKIILRGPALSQSGYGEQTRFALRALRAFPETFDIYLINTNWGNTGWIWDDNEERRWIDGLLQKTIQAQMQRTPYDISLQVTIPNEWEPMAPINIGYTAGIETTKISPQWMEKSLKMNKIIFTSEHAKYAFEHTECPATNNMTGQQMLVKVNVPMDVVNYPVRFFNPEPIDIELKNDFNFLVVAQWSPRKNLEKTIKFFVEEFIDKKVGLLLKINTVNNSLIDREFTNHRLKDLLNEYKDKKCSVQLLHGDLTPGQMTTLYAHPKIKALINLAHGEGFGLPMFEAVYNGLPVIAPAWGGQCDFIFMDQKDKKKNKVKPTAMISAVEYDINKVQPEAVWNDIIIADASWCFPKDWRYKAHLRELHKNYGFHKSRANKLKDHVIEKFTEQKMYKKFADSIYSLPTTLTMDGPVSGPSTEEVVEY